jgi:hypothetical protein
MVPQSEHEEEVDGDYYKIIERRESGIRIPFFFNFDEECYRSNCLNCHV